MNIIETMERDAQATALIWVDGNGSSEPVAVDLSQLADAQKQFVHEWERIDDAETARETANAAAELYLKDAGGFIEPEVWTRNDGESILYIAWEA